MKIVIFERILYALKIVCAEPVPSEFGLANLQSKQNKAKAKIRKINYHFDFSSKNVN